VIYVVGDSHSLFFDGHPGFRVNHVGPHCAYNLDKYADGIVAQFKKIENGGDINEGDECLLTFGEIDCRAHLPLRPKEVPICVNRYAMAATSIRDRVPGLFFGFWGATSSCPLISWARGPLGWEVAGTMQERNKITREFNQLLAEVAKEIGFYFVSIFEKTVKGLDSDSSLFHDYYHMSQKAWPLAVEAWREYRGKHI
jgi:hypothetical protein